MTETGKASSMVAAMRAGETGVSRATHAAPAENPDGPTEPDLFRAFEAEVDAIGGTLAPPVRRGPGRPVGSADRTTAQMKRFMAARGYRDPMEVLGAISSADPVILADALCEGLQLKASDRAALRIKVLGEVRKAAADRLPYEHRRMPQMIETPAVDPNAGRTLIMITDGPTHVSVGAGPVVQQNQGLSVHAAIEGVVVSDGTMSDEGE